MKKGLSICSILLLATLSIAAKGPASSHSNAPGSTDHDKGKDRASDVGKGKHKGLKKSHSKHA